ncbi:glycosyltransferase family 2 protein [Legionella waltersii]|uniref:Undecaprenyl-phosphate mannosyltransferase n=1 Tax=Legionella waltersii TaxID=66969 RepID=A0A0W1AN64_9GAMM|nr:glycosyltransferase family 2 protein [Legionella waltersii]KTD82767.1 Undecaprenyl-phosphate mannosyltransferase [Legionella waltersii]SNV01186.1 glycosyltransferase [Legionella waltersii]
MENTEHLKILNRAVQRQVNETQPKIAVIIPSYKVKHHILDVINAIDSEVCAIYIVDDNCPEQTGDFVVSNNFDPRVKVLKNDHNLGVGGAVMRGYAEAILEGADILVKIDGDNQMDPKLIPVFVAPILAGDADYAKGNRFSDPESLAKMPKLRLFGNAILSFLTKLSSGYWNVFDPTNGYTALHARVAERIPFHKISKRYFFETDLLFRLNSLGAVVVDIPIAAVYEDEKSNMKISRIIPEFIIKHLRNFAKRIVYRYILRDFSMASIELLIGLFLLGFGVCYGGYRWYLSSIGVLPAPPGAVMLAALPVIIGMQFLLAFFHYDILSVPKRALHPNYSLWRSIQEKIKK